MSARLEEIRRQVAELLKDVEELRRLKFASEDVQRFRRMIVKSKYDCRNKPLLRYVRMSLSHRPPYIFLVLHKACFSFVF